MAAIIYDNNTRKFSVLDDEFQKHFSEVRTFAKKFSKETAEKKVKELKAEASKEKDPKRKESLAKRIAKWTAIAAGVAGAGYLGNELYQGVQEANLDHAIKSHQGYIDAKYDDGTPINNVKELKQEQEDYKNQLEKKENQLVRSDLVRNISKKLRNKEIEDTGSFNYPELSKNYKDLHKLGEY